MQNCGRFNTKDQACRTGLLTVVQAAAIIMVGGGGKKPSGKGKGGPQNTKTPNRPRREK